MAMSSTLLAVIFALLFGNLTVSSDLISPVDDPHIFAREVEEAKLKIARLELILDERIGEINAKNRYFLDCEKKIEEFNAQIDLLQTTLSTLEHDYSTANSKLTALEEEVRLLWGVSRKNNFEIHSLEHKALDAERRLNEVTSLVAEMGEIVSEQWIQIQQLEQAVFMAKTRTSKIRKELWGKCPFVKFIVTLYEDYLKTLKKILDPYLPKDMLGFCKSQISQTFAAAQHYHYQLQGVIKNAMKNNGFTAVLAHEEVVFFVASALVAFPIMTACMLLLSQFR